MKQSRRAFLKCGSLAAASLALAGCPCKGPEHTFSRFEARPINHALVAWFSQTGNTQRMGELMATLWRNQNIRVDAADIRELPPQRCGNYDLIMIGAPVNHFDAPPRIMQWLHQTPQLKGIPVAAYVTHGMPPGNQHNTVCTLLEALADKGGIPVGFDTFAHMGTYPPSWAFYPEKTLENASYPNGQTFQRARDLSREVLTNAGSGRPVSFSKEFTFDEPKKYILAPWLSRLVTSTHLIDSNRCTQCGTCRGKCPTGAIDPVQGTVNKSACIDCMACINNCPNQAVQITYMGKRLVGYFDFLRDRHIVVPIPAELRS